MNFSLILPQKASQWASFFASILAASGVTFFLLAAVTAFSQTSTMFRFAYDWSLDCSLTYSTDSLFQLSDAEKQDELERILSTTGVSGAVNVSEYNIYFPDLYDEYSIPFIDFSEPLLQNMRYDLLSGSYPTVDQENQILLPTRFQGMCEVGDVLKGYYIENTSKKDLFETPVNVTVAGFLKEQPILNTSATRTGLGSLSDNFSWQSEVKINGFEKRSGVTFGLLDSNGNRLSPSPSSFYLIRADVNYPLPQLKEELSKVVMSPIFLHTGTDMIQTYIDESQEEISETIVLCVTAIVLSISILTSSLSLELVYRKREMAIMYLCGKPWSRCVWTILAGQILPIVIGFLIGLLLFAGSSDWHLFFILAPQLGIYNSLITLILQLAFISLAVIPFRFSTGNRSPYDLFRKD